MARQYIGARYVPLIMGEWDNSKNYEPLSIVTFLGNSYTSKNFVTNGKRPDQNPDLWAVTGNYNAQVDNYREETRQVSQKVDRISSEFSGEINKLKKKYHDFIGKHIRVYGDSWVDSGLPYHEWTNKLADITGATVTSKGVSGICISDLVGQIDNTVADIYIIEGGINDWDQNRTSISVRDSVYHAVSKLKAINPSCMIYFLTIPGQVYIPPRKGNGAVIYYPAEVYRQAVWTGVDYFGGRVIDGNRIHGLTLTTDSLHPDGNASLNILANYVADCLYRGGDGYSSHAELRVIPNEGVFKISGGLCEYSLSDANLSYTAGKALFPSWYATIDDIAYSDPLCCMVGTPGGVIPSYCKYEGGNFVVNTEKSTISGDFRPQFGLPRFTFVLKGHSRPAIII